MTTAIIGITMFAFASMVHAEPAGDIAYLSGSREDHLTVCVLHLDSGVIDSVGTGQSDGKPDWSPDGAHLAHTFAKDGERRLRIVAADGSGAKEIASPGGPVQHPRWSPNGGRIAFVAGLPNSERIYVYDHGSNVSTPWGADQPPLMQPVWIAEDRLAAVGRIGRPGSQTTDLFWVTRARAVRIDDALPEFGEYVEWAPASPGVGEFLAFESNDGGDREIFVYAPQRGAIDVSNHRAADWNPRWSPDRRSIAFESFRGGYRGVYQVDALRVLVTTVSAPDTGNAWDPAWSSDGQWIAFVSDQSGKANLFATPARGGDAVQLTDGPGLQLAPAWRPIR